MRLAARPGRRRPSAPLPFIISGRGEGLPWVGFGHWHKAERQTFAPRLNVVFAWPPTYDPGAKRPHPRTASSGKSRAGPGRAGPVKGLKRQNPQQAGASIRPVGQFPEPIIRPNKCAVPV